MIFWYKNTSKKHRDEIKETQLEKNDAIAMIIAALITFIPVIILIIGVFIFVINIFF